MSLDDDTEPMGTVDPVEAAPPLRFGSWDWDPAGDRMTWSPELVRILGTEPAEAEPSLAAFLDRVHPDERETVAGAMRRAAEDRRPYLLEHRVVLPSGGERTLHCYGQAIEAADGVRLAGICQDITQRRAFESRLQYLADHDPLTGLVNRRRFTTELDGQIAFNARYGGQGAAMIIDVDRFKIVNDTLGHHAGDDLIRRVATLLEERVRATDSVARLAGDEFAVLMPQVTREGAQALAEDIADVVRNRAGAESGAAQITVSIGISMFGGDADSEEVLVSADMAMYQAKEEGRDRITLFSQVAASRERRDRGQTSAARIRDALQDDRFVLFGQPILDLRSGDIERRELLLRLEGEGGEEPIAARYFIETAEQTGMIGEIDRWVVARAIAMQGEAEERGEDSRLHVNISGASITDAAVIEFIERALDEGDADPTRITFEITETTAIHNISRAAGFADRLIELGCELAIDDYGAGFGPFHYLKHMPFDLIKIDGEFVRDLPRNDADQLTVKALVQIAAGLGKRTIAEYVEEEETAVLLRDYGVDMAQGFHLGRPAALNGNGFAAAPA